MISIIKNIAHYVNWIKNGMTVVIDPTTALTRIYTGHKIYVNPSDISVSAHLMLEGYWEKEIVDLFLLFIKDDSIVFDVGSNLGYFGIVASTINQNGKIYSFEANPSLCKLQEKSMYVNGLEGKYKIVNKAISNEKGKISLHIHDSLLGSSYIDQNSSSNSDDRFKSTEVEMISLDDFCAHNDFSKVDLMKIDVEGVEDLVISGSTNIIANNPNIVLFLEFSFHRYKNESEFFKTLIDIGNVYEIRGANCVKRIHELDQLDSTNGWTMLIITKIALMNNIKITK